LTGAAFRKIAKDSNPLARQNMRRTTAMVPLVAYKPQLPKRGSTCCMKETNAQNNANPQRRRAMKTGELLGIAESKISKID